MLNVNFNQFKSGYLKKKNQVLFFSINTKGEQEIINLINNLLIEKNSFVFESVGKGKIKGRYTIFGRNPDKIWEFNNNRCQILTGNKKKILIGNPKENIEKIIEEFKFNTPKNLPPICSLISGYFSYDIIRYIERIPNKNKDDLNIPDARILRPRNLVIHDNVKSKLYFIVNVFSDEKIQNLKTKYEKSINEIEQMVFLANYSQNSSFNEKIIKLSPIKSNTSKKKFISNVKKAKKYIKIGDIFQVVLSQRFQTKLTKKPLEIYKKLRKTNPSPFMYFFNFNDFQIIGASPEILVRLRNNKITIRPIAGTRPRGKNKKEDNFFKKDLLQDKKELSEI